MRLFLHCRGMCALSPCRSSFNTSSLLWMMRTDVINIKLSFTTNGLRLSCPCLALYSVTPSHPPKGPNILLLIFKELRKWCCSGSSAAPRKPWTEALQHTAFAEPSYIVVQQKVISMCITFWGIHRVCDAHRKHRMEDALRKWIILITVFITSAFPSDRGEHGWMDELCNGKRRHQDCPLSFLSQLLSVPTMAGAPSVVIEIPFPSLWTTLLWPGRLFCPLVLVWRGVPLHRTLSSPCWRTSHKLTAEHCHISGLVYS